MRRSSDIDGAEKLALLQKLCDEVLTSRSWSSLAAQGSFPHFAWQILPKAPIFSTSSR
jgi:hypothetical protein